MKKLMLSTLIVIFCICLLPVQSLPCSSFVLDSGTSAVVGKNLDYYTGAGLLTINKRGVEKKTMAQAPDTILTWTSKFGSVTFTFFSLEFPFGGMNEAGLVIETMGFISGTEYPEPDSRPGIGGFKWVQYQLDNCSTVDEVIASDKIMRIPQTEIPKEMEHFLVTDSMGNSASIEWVDGKMVCHTGDTFQVKVLTNNTYDQSLSFLKWFKGFGGIFPIPNPIFYRGSLVRFVRAADMIRKYDPQIPGPAIDYAFDILSSVAQLGHGDMQTRWSIVYDKANHSIYFRTIGNDNLRYFNLSSFDFSCTTPVKALDINADLLGDVTSSFVDYTEEMGRELLKKYMPSMTEDEINPIVTYPDKYTHCTE
jgi:penicillin V acylase-like amidase (Ntn superfamily)